ncbi:MAG TPA: hypothetical protein VF173_00430 [Thermoanaerobaculia bacterium]|nr:hypothetical protein [Thermoanaerobaculia bacterium]
MPCELWAIDAGGGEAILRVGRRWYLSSMDRAWRPVEVKAPQGVLEWSLSRHVVPVGRQYEDLERAVITARRLCLEAWRTGGTTSGEVGRLLSDEAPLPADDGWGRRQSEIIRQAVKLDHYFEVQGCTSEESLRLTLQVLQELQESGDWRRLWGRSLLLRLLNDAREVYLRQGGDAEKASPELSDYQQRLYKKNLQKLSFDELSCLSLWADGDYTAEEVATVLGLSAEMVLGRLSRAAAEMGRPLVQLREPALAEFCRMLLSRFR